MKTPARPRDARKAKRNPPPQGEVSAQPTEGVDAPHANAVRAEPAPAGYAQLIWMQIEPDPLNPRKRFDEEAIDELAASIARDGLLENLVVRESKLAGAEAPFGDWVQGPGGVALKGYRLVAGERRHRAIKRLIEAGQWSPDAPILCRVVDIDDAGHRRIALVENLQRKDLRPIDEANALKELMALEDKGTAEIAQEIGFTQRFVQQRLQLLELPVAEQTAVQEGRMSIEQARQWLSNRPKPLELTDRQMVVYAEALHRMRHHPRKGGYAGGAITEVSFKAASDGDLKALQKANVLSFTEEDWSDRRAYLSRSWAGRTLMEEMWPKLEPAGVDNPFLVELRTKAARTANIEAAAAKGEYLTAWLNGPFDLSPAAARKIAEDKARKAKERDDAKAAKAKRDDARASFVALDEELREAALIPVDPRVPDMLARLRIKMPLGLKNGKIVAADGEIVFDCSWRFGENGECVNLLLASLVNAAAGAYAVDAAEEPEDPELTPALRALAGGAGERRAIAEPEAADAP